MQLFTIHNKSTATVLSLVLSGVLVLQTLYPTIAYALANSTDTKATTTEEITEEAPTDLLDEIDTAGSPTADESAKDETDEETTVESTSDQTPASTTTITTGDATSGLTTDTEVNYNEVEVGVTASSSASSSPAASTAAAHDDIIDPTSSTTNETDHNATSSSDAASTTEQQASSTAAQLTPEKLASTTEPTTSTTITATNAATTTTTATSAALTGGNAGSGETVTIQSGNAIAYADVLNVVNTNIVNSDGLVRFLNGTLGYKDFDLRSDFALTYTQFGTAESTPRCESGICGTTTTLSSSNNTATINNDLTVIADTGGNQASGTDTTITSGNAYASANVINVANTNVTDSEYLLLVFNSFADYTGDIVLPNSSFFEQYLAGEASPVGTGATAVNDAIVTNEVSVVADSGGNSATGDDASVQTGNTGATSDVFNVLNQNLINSSSFKMLVRVHGDWTGSISGLPEGLTWHETAQGIEIISKDNSRGGGAIGSDVTSHNQADINNQVKVYALTGDNRAEGDTARIQTGNAYADSSIMNIANTNVIGSNWSNLIFTIYGNWDGNLTFGGYPDLWLGLQAVSADTPIMPGSTVTYTFTVFNRGDTTARDVTLNSQFERGTLSFDSPGQDPQTDTRWSLGDLGAGETREISYRATVSDQLDGGRETAIPLTAFVESSNEEQNNEDNTDTVTIYVGEEDDNEQSTRPRFPAHFDISKSADHTTTQEGDVVTYEIELFSRGGQLYDALLVDTLYNDSGEAILTQSWPLGTVRNWENIKFEYSVEFDENFAPGTYTNEAQLIGFHGSEREIYQRPYESPVVNHVVHHRLAPTGQVLGASTERCTPYLTEYLRRNGDNPPIAVMKLQIFFNALLGSELPVTGTFGSATEAAVRTFQERYAGDILNPWGIKTGTGYVYYTTQQKINEIMCGGTRNFPLTAAQQASIAGYKNR